VRGERAEEERGLGFLTPDGDREGREGREEEEREGGGRGRGEGVGREKEAEGREEER